MISAEALQKVGLRKRRAKREERDKKSEAARLASAQKSAELNRRLRAVDMESWYEEIKEHTYRTTFVDITPEDARAMMANYRREGTDIKTSTVTSEQRNLLQDLEQRIASAMLEFGEGASVFAKLSSRSPKDSTMCRDRALALVQTKLMALREAGEIVDSNAVKIAIMGATIESLELRSASEVMNCFATSNRVCEDDLPLALSYPKTWSQHIVLRQWIHIPTAFEFRAWVFDNRLTALCQYWKGVYFPELLENRQVIQDLVQRCFEDIKGVMPVTPAEYSMDIAVDLKQQRAYVIELNPFGKPDGMGTGTVLFNGAIPGDMAVLFGEAPFEFRLEATKQEEDLSRTMKGPLKDWLQAQNFITSDTATQ